MLLPFIFMKIYRKSTLCFIGSSGASDFVLFSICCFALDGFLVSEQVCKHLQHRKGDYRLLKDEEDATDKIYYKVLHLQLIYTVKRLQQVLLMHQTRCYIIFTLLKKKKINKTGISRNALPSVLTAKKKSRVAIINKRLDALNT